MRAKPPKGLLMDGGHANPAINLHKEFVSLQNINQLFEKHQVPEEFDLLSIDLDYDDYWVWSALDPKYRPRVLVIEHNSVVPAKMSLVVDPEDKRRWTGTSYYGASLRAMADLGRRRGYTLVAVDAAGVNAFFVRQDILECQKEQPLPVEQVYVAMEQYE
ncbi:Conserved secreted isoform A [Micractinium conductrix]|uniref:Conserved secreted isoform A n=1 Tax=Micractinium conductrix TaxID=554055 RepID=A0A2P6VQ88_9CHLO|nr:Conserved secreted isoform B [Micractinium conductrix]PSC76249.1 Conserved secreted isoform A [Micractinium conductrix]|eukprot:PSC76248.1 Conserved secreted isoform B [Micractinium conductrix]